MKRILRFSSVALLIATLSCLLYGCGGKSMKEADEWNNNPSIVSRNKEESHTYDLFSYDSVEDALKGEGNKSDNYIDLNGQWDFKLVKKASDVPDTFMTNEFSTSDWDSITVPSNWEVKGFSLPVYSHDAYAWNTSLHPVAQVPEDNEIGLYKRTINVPKEWNGREIYISLQGVESACYVYVNGNMVGYGEDSYTAKDFRITSFLNYGEDNDISIKVFKYSDGSWLEAQNNLKLGGIYRDVFLYSAPKTQVKDVFFKTQFTEDMSSAILYTTVNIGNYNKAENGDYAQISLYDEDGNIFVEPTNIGSDLQYSKDKTGGAFLASTNNRISVSNMHLWSADDPYLYTAVIGIYNKDGKLIDVTSQKIGFHQIAFSVDNSGNKNFTINGKPSQLYGVIYNEYSSVNGNAVTEDEMISDIKSMKMMNINAVRSPGTAYSSKFLSLCDQYGLYVVSDTDISTYPQSTGDSALPGDQAIWQTAALDRLTNVLYRDRNHASVIMWSLGSQSGSGSVMATVKNWLISNESRLVMYDGYYEEDDNGKVEFNCMGDIISTTDWPISKIEEVLNDDSIISPMMLVNTKSGLLSSSGDVSTYVDLMENNAKIQGCFLSYWKDYSLYLPKNTANAVSVCSETPYETNPDLYTLQYAASWSKPAEGSSATDQTKYSLLGVVSGDGTIQSDAYQIRNTYSPVNIKAVDVAAGKFTVTNRNVFTPIDKNYVISYTVYSAGNAISQGDIDIGQIACGETKDFVINYGNISASSDYYVDIKVVYTSVPSWANEDFDKVVYDNEFDVSGASKPVKSGIEAKVSGPAFAVTEFMPPEIKTTDTDIAKGIIYITNPSSQAFDSLYNLNYKIIETSAGISVVYASGNATTGVKAGDVGASVKLPYNVKALKDASYEVILTVTTKSTAGSVASGTELVYDFSPKTLEVESIPFSVDETRTGIAEGDTYVAPANGYDAIPSGFITLNNDNVSIEFDANTGLIKTYKVNGTDIFSADTSASNGPMASIFRSPMGGDYELENLESIKNASKSEGQSLTNNIVMEKIAQDHYRVKLDYRLYDYDSSVVNLLNNNSLYEVVYDIYGNGVMNVSTAFKVNNKTGIPTQLANVLSLDSNLSSVTWYGRGPGESYKDKLADTKVGKYTSQTDKMIANEFLMPTGAGDRSQTSWVSFQNADGNGVMITSDTNLFSFNISKTYSWEDSSYIRDDLSKNYNVVNIIGLERGATAGTPVDQQYTGVRADITSGTVYSFSYRFVPVTQNSDLDNMAAEKVSSSGTASVKSTEIKDGQYALSNVGVSEKYLTSGDENCYLNDALGSLSQQFRIGTTGFVSETGIKGITLTNKSNGLALSPVSGDSGYTDINVGLAAYSLANKWQVWYQNGTELTPMDTKYAMTVSGGDEYGLGYRIALKESSKSNASAWTISKNVNDDKTGMVKNTSSGLYLTSVDNLKYAKPTIGTYDSRNVNYPLDTDWSNADATSAASIAKSSWVQLQSRVTLWELLPSDIQSWKLVSKGNGIFEIQNVSTGYKLGIRNVTDAATKITTPTLVQFNPKDDGEEPASVQWKITDLGGYASIINTQFDLALQAQGQRGYMSQQDRDYYYITNIEDATVINYTMTVGKWNGTANQKWTLYSSDDLSVNIEANDGWLK